TRFSRDWSSDVCSSDLVGELLRRLETLTSSLGCSRPVGVLRFIAVVRLGQRLSLQDLHLNGSLGKVFHPDFVYCPIRVESKAARSEERRVGKACRCGGG